MANKRKDEKIQVYLKVTKPDTENLDSTIDLNYRQFIYSEDLYNKGGLYARAQALKSEEAVGLGFSVDKIVVKFTVNRNPKINSNLKVIYRGDVYDISSVDPFDFRSPEISFTAVLTGDTTKYTGGDLFD